MAKRERTVSCSSKRRSLLPNVSSFAWCFGFFLLSSSISNSSAASPSAKICACSLLWLNTIHAWIPHPVLPLSPTYQHQYRHPQTSYLQAALDANKYDTLNQTKATSLSAASTDTNNDNDTPNSGYQFGDITRSLLRKSAQGVNQLTGKDEYEFGDLSKWMTQKLQQDSQDNTAGYQFGDLSRSVARQIQAGVSNYTGKETYQVGDISSTILSKVQSGEYSSEDLWLALRVLISAGLTLATPVAAALPTKIVMEMINVGLAQEVTGRLLALLANILDQRLKQALTGNAQYMLGDITKEKLEQGLQRFTGKESYEIGDISRTIQQLQAQATAKDNSKASSSTSSGKEKQLELASDVVRALSKLDPKN